MALLIPVMTSLGMSTGVATGVGCSIQAVIAALWGHRAYKAFQNYKKNAVPFWEEEIVLTLIMTEEEWNMRTKDPGNVNFKFEKAHEKEFIAMEDTARKNLQALWEENLSHHGPAVPHAADGGIHDKVDSPINQVIGKVASRIKSFYTTQMKESDDNIVNKMLMQYTHAQLDQKKVIDMVGVFDKKSIVDAASKEYLKKFIIELLTRMSVNQYVSEQVEGLTKTVDEAKKIAASVGSLAPGFEVPAEDTSAGCPLPAETEKEVSKLYKKIDFRMKDFENQSKFIDITNALFRSFVLYLQGQYPFLMKVDSLDKTKEKVKGFLFHYLGGRHRRHDREDEFPIPTIASTRKEADFHNVLRDHADHFNRKECVDPPVRPGKRKDVFCPAVRGNRKSFLANQRREALAAPPV